MKTKLLQIAFLLLLSIQAKSQTINISVPLTVASCKGVTVSIATLTIGTFGGGNVFNYYLSDASGSFASPTLIYSYPHTPPIIELFNVNATIPLSTPNGAGYLIKVVSTAPGLDYTTTNPFSIYDTPPVPTNPIGATRCSVGTLNISATAPPACSIDWYAAPTGGVALATGTSTFTTPSLSSTTIYYAEARNTVGGCVSATRTAVTATIGTVPVAPTSPISGVACTNGSAIISATPPIGCTLDWYAAASGGSVLAGGTGVTSFTTPVISTATTYYAQSRNTTTGCISATRTAVTATVSPSFTVTSSASSVTICNGSTINLFSGVTTNSATLLTEGFANANPSGWTKTNTSTGGTVATAAWQQRPNNYNPGNTISSNNNSTFYNSDSRTQNGTTTATTLVSPAINTNGYTSLILDFYHYYRYDATSGEFAKIDVSTNGTTWTNVATYTSNQGLSNSFAHPSIDLSAYVGNTTLYFRFNYYCGGRGRYWAIDNISLKGTPSVNYSWTSSPAGFTSSTQNPTNVAPTVSTSYTCLITSVAGCSVSTTPLAITVNPILTPSVSISATATSICTGTSVTFTASPTNGGVPTYQWKKNGVNTVTGATYTSSGFVNGDVITCVMTSTATCASPTTATSNSVTMTVGTGTWLGLTNNWSTGTNWCGGVPIASTDVSIATGVPFQPQLSASSVCNNINLGASSTLTLNGQLLTLSGAFSGAGKIIGSSSSSLTVLGTGNAGTLNMSAASANSKSLANLTLNRTSSGFLALGDTVNIIGTLTLTNGTLTTNGKLKLYASVSGTGRIATIVPANANITGNIIAEGYAPGGNTDWAYLGSPVTNATIADWTSPWDVNNTATSFGIPTSGFTGSTGNAGGSFVSIYSYDESVGGTSGNGYTAATNVTNTLINGKGYDVYLGRSYGTTTDMKFRVTGTPQIGNATIPVSYTNNLDINNDGWNLVANPYPSPIDWNSASWTKTNMDNAVYIYNADYGGMSSYVSGISTNGGSNIIAMHQGFMVKANATSPILNATENVKVASNQAILKSSSEYGDNAILKLAVTKNGTKLRDENVVRFNSLATTEFDSNLEAIKHYSSRADGLNLMTVSNNTEYAINALPQLSATTMIPIKMKLSGNGLYTLNISQIEDLKLAYPSLFENDELILENFNDGSKINLTSSMDYSFAITNGDSIVKFAIYFNKENITTNINNSELFDVLKIRIINGEYFVESHFEALKNISIQVSNILGQTSLPTIKLVDKNSLQKIETANLTPGIYFINVTANNKTISKKIIIE